VPESPWESETGWIVADGELRVAAITLDTAQAVLQILLPDDGVAPAHIAAAWTALLRFWTIPAKEGDEGLCFQVRFIGEVEPVAEVSMFRQLRQVVTGGSWPLIGAGYQFLFTPPPPGLREYQVWSQDHTTIRNFVAAVEQSDQFRLLADCTPDQVTVVTTEVE
jgi:hypothetical protein